MGAERPNSAHRDGDFIAAVGFKTVEQPFPRAAFSLRQRKWNRLGRGIEREDISNARARLGAAESVAEAPKVRVFPIPNLHFAAVGAQPGDVFQPARSFFDAPIECAAAQIGMTATQQDHAPYER